MPSSVKEKFDETKTFVKKHQIIIACSVTAVATYAIVRDPAAKAALKEMTTSLAIVSGEYSENALGYLTALEFIDHKNLTSEFDTFFQMQNG